MSDLTREKLAQAVQFVAESEMDVWLTFVRETVEGGDPILPFLLEGGLTWISALVVSRTGKKVAIVGNFDADALKASGDWDLVVPYVQGIRQPLLDVLDDLIAPPIPLANVDAAQLVTSLVAPTVEAGVAAAVGMEHRPRIGVNFSLDDVKADGLSHGMFLLLESLLKGTRFEGCLVNAQGVCSAVRGLKSPRELEAIQAAIQETDAIFGLVQNTVRVGMTEREVFDLIHTEMGRRGLGYAWDRNQDPIVNSGPDSMVGHGIPSGAIRIEPGHVFHIDLGVVKGGYSSDIQRCWYVPHDGEKAAPADVIKAMEAVVGAINAGAEFLKPGVEGWKVDHAARMFLTGRGYPEYMHAFGHQVGRMAHDGGAILGPRWERYGKTPTIPIREGEVYTLELGVTVEGRGYLGIEEMARVTSSGVEWLTERQLDMPMLGR